MFRADTEAFLNGGIVYNLDFRLVYALYKTEFGIRAK